MSDPITLAARMDAPAAQGLLTTLSGSLDDDIVLDMTDVTYLGALSMQVMISAASSATANGHSLSLINTSDRVIDQLRVMGMTPEAIGKGHQ